MIVNAATSLGKSSRQRYIRPKMNLCSFCPAVFSSVTHLQRHIRTHSGEKPFKCSICPARFSERGNLTVHTRIHRGERPFGCTVCQCAFHTSSGLKIHARIHTRDMPYSCGMCERKFSDHANLSAHRRIHTGEKPYVCAICSVGFHVSSELTVHTRRNHTMVRPYVCHICEEDFPTAGRLASHIRVHTGEKTHRCRTCPAAFREQSDRIRHERIHTGEKPFTCDVTDCSYRTADARSLIRHRQGYHDIGLATCCACDAMVYNTQVLTDTEDVKRHLCRPCYAKMTGYSTRAEQSMVKYLETHLPVTISGHNQKVRGALGMAYRPDVAYLFEHFSLYIECDEKQHRNTSYTCDEQRMGDIAAETPHIPCVFVRFNPDNYSTTTNRGSYRLPCVPLFERLSILASHVQWIIHSFDTSQTTDTTQDKTDLALDLRIGDANLIVHYLFYDKSNDTCVRSPSITVNFYHSLTPPFFSGGISLSAQTPTAQPTTEPPPLSHILDRDPSR